MMKILVLGYFGYQTNQLDGQTVKTRDLYRLAKEQLTDCDVEFLIHNHCRKANFYCSRCSSELCVAKHYSTCRLTTI